MDNGLRRRGYANWILPGDQKVSPLSDRKIPGEQTPQVPRTDSIPPIDNPVLSSVLNLPKGTLAENIPLYTWRLLQCATALPLSYMAVLPQEQPSRLEEPFGKTVQDYMNLLTGNPHFLMHKWRESVLLVNYPNWFYGEDLPVPYRLLAQLRSQALANGGYLPIGIIGEAIRTLSASQIGRLGEEFPVLPEALNWEPMQLCKSFPNVLTVQGLPMKPEVMAVLRQFVQIAPEVRLLGVRLHQENRDVQSQPMRVLSLQFRSERRDWSTVGSIVMQPGRLKTQPAKNSGRKR
jgi:hypothetical protein